MSVAASIVSSQGDDVSGRNYRASPPPSLPCLSSNPGTASASPHGMAVRFSPDGRHQFTYRRCGTHDHGPRNCQIKKTPGCRPGVSSRYLVAKSPPLLFLALLLGPFVVLFTEAIYNH